MLTNHAAVDTVFDIDRRWRHEGYWRRLACERHLISALRARNYDLIIHLTENPRGAVLGRLLGARYRVAREYPQKRRLFWRSSFTHLYPVPGRPRHTVETHLDALRRIGLQPEPDERRLVLVPGADAEGHIETVLR